jgi:hypothetical protein
LLKYIHTIKAKCFSHNESSSGLYIRTDPYLSFGVWFFLNRFTHTMLHYTIILHVLIYTLLHHDWFPFVLIWMVICLLPTYNMCAIYTRNSLFSLLHFAEIYRFNKLWNLLNWCMVGDPVVYITGVLLYTLF